MKRFKPVVFLTFILIFFLSSHVLVLSSEKIVIRADRMLDVESGEIIKNAFIVVEGQKIVGVGDSNLEKGVKVIDLGDMTLLPGLIDMHVHLQGGWANGTIRGERYKPRYDDKSVQQSLNAHLYAGVTTVLDCGSDHEYILEWRKRINDGTVLGPRFFTTGAPWDQEPSGWEAGNTTGDNTFGNSTKVTSIAKISEQMDKYKEDDIEIIKLYSGLSPHAAGFVVKEAHTSDIVVIADFWRMNMDRIIMEATGLNGWAHCSPSEVPDSSNKWMAENDRFCIVTATLGEAMSGLRVKDEDGKKLMLKEPLIVDVWGEDNVKEFYAVYPQIRHNYYDGPEAFYQQNGFGDLSRFRAKFLENIKNAYDAGVLIAGGSDCVYPSLWDGEVMHREMELLVKAGISEVQAIMCCTHNGAKILRRDKQFGSIQKGMSADILIVEGNPAKNISDTRNVKHVFLKGKQVDRNSLKMQ